MRRALPTTWILAAALLAAATSPGPARAQDASDATRQAEALIRALAADTSAEREQATQKLIEMGPDVIGLVAKTLASTDDPEVKLRCGLVLKGMRLVERRIADLGAVFVSYPSGGWTRSENGEARAWTAKAGENMQFFVNGKMLGEHRQIEGFSVSADGRRFAYQAREVESVDVHRGRRTELMKMFAVIDGAKGPDYVYAAWPYFSPDGKHVAYAARKGEKWRVVRDGVEGREYDMVNGPVPWADSDHLIYPASRGGKTFIVIDGVEGPPHDQLWPPRGPQSKRYVAADADEMWAMEADPPGTGAAGPERVSEKRLKLLGKIPPGLKDFGGAFVTSDAQQIYFQIMRPVTEPTFFNGNELTGVWDWHFSADNRHVGLRARRKEGELVIHDGKEGPLCDKVEWLSLSPSGEHAFYFARRGGRWLAMRDDQEYAACEKIQSFSFSRDERHLAVLTIDQGARSIVLDGASRPVPPTACGVRLSGDARHLAYEVFHDRKRFLVIDGKRCPDHDHVQDVVFSGDDRHVRYVATDAGRKSMVVDGIPGPPHENILMEGFTYETGTSFRYVVVDGGRETLVEMDWPRGLDASNGLEPMEP